MYSTHGNLDIERQVLERVLAMPNLLGVVYATVYTRKVAPPAALLRVPTVLLNCTTGDGGVSSVVPAEVAGGQLATAHLLRAGHRRIGFVNGEPWQDAARDRLRGYRTALAGADVAFAPELALGAIEAVKQRGLRVPDDVSVVGYDDQAIARHTHPPLTTVVLPNHELGRRAVEMLMQEAQNRAAGVPVRRHALKLDGPLVERGSVRRVAMA